jgi:S1-C subfamily serine protease
VNPITLTHNRWRCDQGWDVDLDDGSTNYVITNNVFLSGGLKWREGYYRDGENNVLVQQRTTPCAPNAAVEDVSGCLSIHVWPKSSGDVFTHNIFWGLAPDSPDGYGKEIDYNLFQSASQLSTAQGTYHTDAHSASGNPNFIDPTNGNFQLGANSPATALGIVSLPAPTAEQYGVTVPQLRAQAATPPFGNVGLKPVNTDAGVRDCTTQTTWRGATIENLCPGEFSIVGLGNPIGVFMLTVPAGSQATTDGLLALDVILQLDGQSVTSLDDLNRLYNATTASQKVTLGIYRNQQDSTVTITH